MLKFVLVGCLALLITAQLNTTVDDPRVARGVLDFTAKLFRVLGSENKNANVFWSPYSVSEALAMVSAGGVGATEGQIRKAISSRFNSREIHSAQKYHRDRMIAARKSFNLTVANGVFVDQQWKLLAGFESIVQGRYNATVEKLDFATEQGRSISKNHINDWIASRTNNRIKDMLQDISNDTKVMLVNAIFFKADWEHEFEPENTRSGAFTLLSGDKTTAKMMTLGERPIEYLKTEHYESVRLYYKKREASMTIIAPHVGHFDSCKSSFKSILQTVSTGLLQKELILVMPKFKFKTTCQLKDALKKIGMNDSFTYGLADFRKIDGTKSLFISKIQHDAFVSVDEKGTEAAAATIMEMGAGAAFREPYIVRIDRPFLFVIQDSLNTTLFMGQVVDPVIQDI